MRIQLLAAGSATLIIGVLMNLLLSDLRSAFFRAYLPPWVYASYVLVLVGTVLAIGGTLSRPVASTRIGADIAANLFAYAALANVVAAGIFASPLIVPTLKFPILITQWPGIYMTIAYFAFITIGVIGMFCWSLLFRSLPLLAKSTTVFKNPVLVQLLASEVGIYGMSISMFLGGYVGSYQNYIGFGPSVVGIDMEFSVIPSAVCIFIVILSALLGVANVILSRRTASQ